MQQGTPTLRDRIIECAWLRHAERQARGRTERQQAELSRLLADARRWHSAARELSCERSRATALPLYCQALVRFAVAGEISQGEAYATSPLPAVAEALTLVADSVRRRGAGEALDHVIAASRHLPADPPDDERALRALLAAMEALTSAARDAARAPSLRDVLVARGLRVAAGSLIILGLSAALIHGMRAPRNVARGKPVSASSVVQGRPEALVNGSIEWGRFGLTTERVPSYVTIDLGQEYELLEARIFNRGDSYLEEQAPLAISLSVDGDSYSTEGRCTEFFTQTAPCTVSLGGAWARYVRVSRPGEIALSEIEVLAR